MLMVFVLHIFMQHFFLKINPFIVSVGIYMCVSYGILSRIYVPVAAKTLRANIIDSFHALTQFANQTSEILRLHRRPRFSLQHVGVTGSRDIPGVSQIEKG